MNYIKQLTHFFNQVSNDPNISPTHISLFMALFQNWNQSRFSPTIKIARDDIMTLAKINSKATYHRAMGYLHQYRYINYKPSFNPHKGSEISFFPVHTESKNSTQRSNNRHVQNLTTRLINEPFNKLYSNNIIQDNIITSARDQKSNLKKLKNGQVKKEKSSAKKENQIPPNNHQVEEYFISLSSTIQEAHKFINHYTANGWLVGGKTPMKDWEASARNWITNSIIFNKSNKPETRAQQLHTSVRKNYFEPL